MIKITVTKVNKETKEVVGTIVREFSKDSESIQFLKDVDKQKMDGLVKQIHPTKSYKPIMILKHPTSPYGITHFDKDMKWMDGQCNRGVITRDKPLYKELSRLNNIETKITIEHV